MALSFIKKGAESAAMAKQALMDAETRKAAYGHLFNFFLAPGEECQATFCDGELSPEGFLLPPRWYEHNLYLPVTKNGKTKMQWNNFFVCPEKTNPDAHDSCPICESGDFPALIAGFTLIDHRSYQGEKQVYVNTKKLVRAKSQSFELLNKIAVKRGGLAGCRFDISRLDGKVAAIGSMFDFVDKKTIAECKVLYQKKWTDPKTNKEVVDAEYFGTADWEKEIIYRTGAELRAMGLGKPSPVQGMPPGNMLPPPTSPTGPMPDYGQQL